MSTPYKPNEQDKSILEDIKLTIERSLNVWYGEGSRLAVKQPDIRSYRNCFMLHYPVTCTGSERKTVLIKIRRNPKMASLSEAIQADIHRNIPTEYASLELVYNGLAGQQDDFGTIRPLMFVEKYHAIAMEEYPSRTLRTLLVHQRLPFQRTNMHELVDAATKTGRWLYHFHHRMHSPEERPYSAGDIIDTVTTYARRLETDSDQRIKAQSIIKSFTHTLERIPIDTMLFSQSHADMTVDNVLYSRDRKVCIIDIKTLPAPIYSDLGLILTHPETFREQILSRGVYLPQSLLKVYRAAILAGYFENRPVNANIINLFSAIKILDKWAMYEELFHRYRRLKRVVTRPLLPLLNTHFHDLLQRYLSKITA